MRRGSITIYLSVILLSTLLLISIVAESARLNVVRTESKGYTYMAGDSVLAGYARQVYDEYGILLVWETTPVKEQLKKYIQANINMADLNKSGTNFMTTKLTDIQINKVGYVCDEGGDLFTKQIVSYMKYSEVAKQAEKLMNLFEKENLEKDKNSEHVTEVIDTNGSKDVMSDKVQQITEKIEKLKKKKIVLSTVRDKEKFQKKIEQIIKLIRDYRKEKKEFLMENNISYSDDYMDENLIILEQIKDMIEGEKLNDSTNNTDAKLLGEKIKKQIEKLTVYIPSEEDESNKNIYESAKELLDKGILSLVVEETDNISNTTIKHSNLPSDFTEYKKKDVTDALKNKTMLCLYSGEKFGNYMHSKKGNYLSYEQEYIICGNDDDRSNFAGTIEKIVGIRNVETLACLITDKEKQAEISAVALSASTALGLPVLEPIIKAVLNEAWAFAEAINDAKLLVKGESIDIIKKKNNWNTGLKNLLKSSGKGTSGGKTVDYEQICKLLILQKKEEEISYRIMDLIQFNISKKYNPEFKMIKCYQEIKFNAVYETVPLFAAMPWVTQNKKSGPESYKYSIDCHVKY